MFSRTSLSPVLKSAPVLVTRDCGVPLTDHHPFFLILALCFEQKMGSLIVLNYFSNYYLSPELIENTIAPFLRLFATVHHGDP